MARCEEELGLDMVSCTEPQPTSTAKPSQEREAHYNTAGRNSKAMPMVL